MKNLLVELKEDGQKSLLWRVVMLLICLAAFVWGTIYELPLIAGPAVIGVLMYIILVSSRLLDDGGIADEREEMVAHRLKGTKKHYDSEKLFKLIQKKCPDCGETPGRFLEGPHGGMSVNIKCENCGSEFNVHVGMGLVDRIN